MTTPIKPVPEYFDASEQRHAALAAALPYYHRDVQWSAVGTNSSFETAGTLFSGYRITVILDIELLPIVRLWAPEHLDHPEELMEVETEMPHGIEEIAEAIEELRDWIEGPPTQLRACRFCAESHQPEIEHVLVTVVRGADCKECDGVWVSEFPELDEEPNDS